MGQYNKQLAVLMPLLLFVAIIPTTGAFGQEQQQDLPEPTLDVEIVADQTSGSAPLSIDFDSVIVGAEDDGNYSHYWDFGSEDVAKAYTKSVTRVFEEPGVYNVTYGAIQEGEDQNYGIQSILVTVEGETTTEDVDAAQTEGILRAEIEANATEGDIPFTAELTAIVSGGAEPYEYAWDILDDGEIDGEDETIVPTFTEAGEFDVSLLVTDSEGLNTTARTQLVVTEAGNVTEEEPEEEEKPSKNHSKDNEDEEPEAPEEEEPPVEEEPPTNTTEPEPEPEPPVGALELDAVITFENVTGIAPQTFTFVAAVINGIEPYTFSWDFDEDGIEDSDEQTVGYTFEEAGEYAVELIVTDGNDDSVTRTILVNILEGSTEEPPTEEPPVEEPPVDNGTDFFGINMLYPTVAEGGPTWRILEQEDPTVDGYFYLGMHTDTTIAYNGDGSWQVDAQSGTEEHGIRMHVDSPSGTWKNTEQTGYFYNIEGNDQFTMIARHGPSYHDEEGCLAYGYYGMTAIDGNVFFKKKLYHFNDGYTKRLAQVPALEDLTDRWVGIKFVVYDIPNSNGDIKLELWVDEGDETNNWKKVTELVDRGGAFSVAGGDDCGRDASDTIESGTRASFRADDSLFNFKNLSVREIAVPETQ